MSEPEAPGTNPPDWVLGLTEAIWENRGLKARICEFYSADVIQRTPAGVRRGEAAVTRAVLEALHAFPDRVLLGEDVIWTDDEQTGLLSSHRILSRGEHRGDGPFGPATGRRLRYRVISDCFSRGGQVLEEWRIPDTGAILRQIGKAPRDWAAARVADDEAAPLTPETDCAGPYDGRGNDHPLGAQLADLLTRMMEAEFSVIGAEYDRACAVSYPGGVEAEGHGAVERFWLPLRAAFPAALFAVHHVIGRDDALMPPRAALRWSLTGRHEGGGAFGVPSGAPVHVMGITHAEFGPRGVRREWTLFDEAAIWMQILRG